MQRAGEKAGAGSPEGGERAGAAASWAARLVLLRPGEGPALAWSAAYFFLLLLGYFIIRPIRDEMGVAGGVRNLPWLWTGTLAAMLVAHPVYAWLVGRLPRRRFIPLVYHFFALNLVAFFLVIRFGPAEHMVNIGRVFYVWTSVYNLFAVAVFWSFMADLFTHEQGKRLFGAVAVGGTLGAMAGSGVTSLLSMGVEIRATLLKADPATLLLASAVLLQATILCVRRLSALRALPDATVARGSEPPPGVWRGMLLVARSPYLLMISGIMLCYTIASTFLYVEQLKIADAAFETPEARRAFFAAVNFWVNAGTLVMQLLFTGRVLRTLGVSGTLLVLPLVTIAGFAALWLSPVVWTLIAFQVASRAVHFAFDRPSREILYTLVSPEEKYKSKHFIDTFVYRAGDQVGVWGQAALGWLAIPAAAGAIAVGAVWAGLAAGLGVLHARKLRATPPPTPAAP